MFVTIHEGILFMWKTCMAKYIDLGESHQPRGRDGRNLASLTLNISYQGKCTSKLNRIQGITFTTSLAHLEFMLQNMGEWRISTSRRLEKWLAG